MCWKYIYRWNWQNTFSNKIKSNYNKIFGLYTKNFDTEDDVAIYDKENPLAGKNLDLNELFYENDEVIQSIRKYYEDRKGDIKVGNRKGLVEEFVTDMRWSETNEVSAATLAFYIDGASNESKNNFSILFKC